MLSPFDLIKQGALSLLNNGKKALDNLVPDAKQVGSTGIYQPTTSGLIKNTILGIPKATGSVAADIVRAPARAVLSTALSVAPKKTQQKIGQINPEEDFGAVGKYALGEQPIKSIQQKSQENATTLKKYGVSPSVAGPLGVIGSLASDAIDLYPGGSAEKGAVKTLAKTTDKKLIETILKKIGMEEKLIPQFTEKIALAKDEKTVNQLLKDAKKSPLPELPGPKRPVIQDIKPKAPSELERTAQELKIRRESLDNHPAKPLAKYANKNGELPEVLGGVKSKFGNTGDDIVTQHGFPDSETARASYQEYRSGRASLQADEKAFKEARARSMFTPEPKPKVSPLSSFSAKAKNTGSELSTGEARSLEKVAEQDRYKNVPEPLIGQVDSLEDIVRKSPTPVEKKVGIVDNLRTPENVFRKMGYSNEFDAVRKAHEDYTLELPKNIERISEMAKGVSSESNTKIFRYLDGEAVDLTAHEKKVADEAKTYLAEWADRLGLPEDSRITHYITHIFDDQLIAKEFDEDLAKLIAEKVPGQVYDPFLLKRLGAKGYKQDVFAALDAYTKRATRKVHMDPALAQLSEISGKLEKSQFDYVKKFADRVNLRPSDFDTAVDNSIKNIIGYKLGQRPVAKLSRLLRQMAFRGMIGGNISSALRNLSQGVNTFAKLGTKYTGIGYAKMATQGTKELKELGILADNYVQDRTLSSTKKFLEKLDKGLFYLFDTAEKINRGSAYYGAKAKALAEGKTLEQAIEYGKKIVRDTQFQYSAIDTPLALQDDITKIFAQFLTYPIKQTEFLAGMAKNKDMAGLLRYTLGGLTFVYTLGKTLGMEPQELIPFSGYISGEQKFGAPPSTKLPVEITKAVLNTPDKYGQPRDLEKKLKDIGNAAWGVIPGGIQLKKTLQGLQTNAQGGSYDAKGKLQFASGQTPASQVQNVLFGKYSGQNAKDYFAGDTVTKKADAQIKPVYDEIQALRAEGKEEEALAMHSALSEDQKASYKGYKGRLTAQKTAEGKEAIAPIYAQIQALQAQGKTEEALAMHSALSPDEKKYYKLVKAQVAKDKAAASGKKPEFEDGEVVTDQGIIHTVALYAKALGIDPAQAFKALFTKEKLRYAQGNVVVLDRLSLEDSQALKEKQGGKNSEMKLDHFIPLELGGSNDESNLKLVPTEVWATYTEVENYLGKKLRDGKISRSDARKAITDFKNGQITAEEVYNKFD